MNLSKSRSFWLQTPRLSLINECGNFLFSSRIQVANVLNKKHKKGRFNQIEFKY
jgi:hypothetical protein